MINWERLEAGGVFFKGQKKWFREDLFWDVIPKYRLQSFHTSMGSSM